jgi:hypothetical protein
MELQQCIKRGSNLITQKTWSYNDPETCRSVFRRVLLSSSCVARCLTFWAGVASWTRLMSSLLSVCHNYVHWKNRSSRCCLREYCDEVLYDFVWWRSAVFGGCRYGVQIFTLRMQDTYCLVCMLARRLHVTCRCAESGLVTAYFCNFVIPLNTCALCCSLKSLLNQSVGRPFPIHRECYSSQSGFSMGSYFIAVTLLVFLK